MNNLKSIKKAAKILTVFAGSAFRASEFSFEINKDNIKVKNREVEKIFKLQPLCSNIVLKNFEVVSKSTLAAFYAASDGVRDADYAEVWLAA